MLDQLILFRAKRHREKKKRKKSKSIAVRNGEDDHTYFNGFREPVD